MTTATTHLSHVEEQVRRALGEWHKPDDPAAPLSNTLSVQQLLAEQGNHRRAINHLLQQGIQALGDYDPEGARLLTHHYIKGQTAVEIAKQIHVVEQTVFKIQREKIKQLATWVAQREERLYAEKVAAIGDRLERPTYSQLFGVADHLDHLVTLLNTPTAPWLVAIEGMGGMGKTALTDALVRRLLATPHWVDVAWVTARQHLLNLGGGIRPIAKPALSSDALIDALYTQLHGSGGPPRALPEKRAWLRQQMKSRPHLVVIDNLETVVDVETLLESIHALSNPSKFILTTRYNYYHDADQYHFALPELAAADAFALLRAEAHQRNLPALATATDDELHPVYATVGGNPLALRLVVGQAHIYSLTTILGHLRQGVAQSVGNLYTYLYRAAWDALDEPARRTLLLMPLVQEEGEDLAYLQAMGKTGNLTETELMTSLDCLVARNLIDSRGTLHHRRYTIHSLTRTFLQEQVLRWQ
ncbi:MAG: NB-ARC domain-containing protein [Caldilineaceae bacterium]